MRRYALIIGNNEYKNQGVSKLQCAVNDAVKVAEHLSENGFKTSLLTNATGLEIKESLDNISLELEDNDLFLFYFSGHGHETANSHYLLGVKSDPNTFDIDGGSDAVDLAVVSRVTERKNLYRVFILDCCRNNVLNGKSIALGMSNGSATVNAVKPQFQDIIPPLVIRSCSYRQCSYEDTDSGYGFFTLAMLDAMKTASSFAQFIQQTDMLLKERLRPRKLLQRLSLTDCHYGLPLLDGWSNEEQYISNVNVISGSEKSVSENTKKKFATKQLLAAILLIGIGGSGFYFTEQMSFAFSDKKANTMPSEVRQNNELQSEKNNEQTNPKNQGRNEQPTQHSIVAVPVMKEQKTTEEKAINAAEVKIASSEKNPVVETTAAVPVMKEQKTTEEKAINTAEVKIASSEKNPVVKTTAAVPVTKTKNNVKPAVKVKKEISIVIYGAMAKNVQTLMKKYPVQHYEGKSVYTYSYYDEKDRDAFIGKVNQLPSLRRMQGENEYLALTHAVWKAPGLPEAEKRIKDITGGVLEGYFSGEMIQNIKNSLSEFSISENGNTISVATLEYLFTCKVRLGYDHDFNELKNAFGSTDLYKVMGQASLRKDPKVSSSFVEIRISTSVNDANAVKNRIYEELLKIDDSFPKRYITVTTRNKR